MNTYKTLSSEVVFQSKVFDVLRDRVLLPTGSETTLITLTHPGAVVILPKTAIGTFLLVRQYRHSIARTILEFPAGTLEPNEDPLSCAQREIKEEVGHGAKKWQSLGTLYPAPGFCTEIQHLYLAEDLSPETLAGDEDEIIEVVEMSLEEVRLAVLSGELSDGKSLSILLRAHLLGLVCCPSGAGKQVS